MTAQTQDYVDPFAGGDRTPALSFKGASIGTTFTCRVMGPAKLLQSRDYETGELATWPDGNPKMAAVVNVEVDGEERSIWAGKPSSMFTALKDAQKAAGKPFEEGGMLVIKYDSDKPNEKNPRLNPQKIYKARYTPPAPPAPADPFGDEAPF